MIRGQFDENGRPYVRGRLTIPLLGVNGGVNFLLDTGADRTTMHPADGERLRCRFDKLEDPDVVNGVGGTQECYSADAIVTLFGNEADYHYIITIDIVKPSPDPKRNRILQRLPSLLGNDLLDYFDLRYIRRQNIINLTALD